MCVEVGEVRGRRGKTKANGEENDEGEIDKR